MTSARIAWSQQIEAPAEPSEVVGPDIPRERPPRSTPWLVAMWLGSLWFVILLCVAYRNALIEPASLNHYHLFWLAFIGLVPPVCVIFSKESAGATRAMALLCILAALSLPKLLLNPNGPLYHDEYPHWREAQAVAESGHLFRPVSIVPVISGYPGLHGVTAALQLVTGLSTWSSAVVVANVSHLALAAGIYTLSRHFFSPRAAAVAVLLYVLNPSYMYFDAQFAYESLAICFLVWALALVARARQNPRYWPLAGCLAIACVPTHHLTTLMLIAALFLVALCDLVLGAPGTRLRRAAPVAALTVLTGGLFFLWAVDVAPSTYHYLSPYLSTSFTQLLDIGKGAGGSRTLYSGSGVPAYERLAAFVTPFLVLVMSGAALARWLRSGRSSRTTRDGFLVALALLGAMYFISLPFDLTSFGAEGARRSWAFSYVGLAVLLSPWLTSVLERAGLRWRIWALRGTTALALVVLLIGNVSAGLNSSYRFPGPFQFATETRTLTAETIALAYWVRTNLGTGAGVITDRFTGLAVGSYGAANLAVPSVGFPIWELYASAGTPPLQLLRQIQGSPYDYLIIDKRLGVLPTAGSTLFAADEPFAGNPHPFPPDALTKFDAFPWTEKLYASQNYVVYKFDFTQLPAQTAAKG